MEGAGASALSPLEMGGKKKEKERSDLFSIEEEDL